VSSVIEQVSSVVEQVGSVIEQVTARACGDRRARHAKKSEVVRSNDG
jgi:hypothetical protein